ncbi:MAG: hypothetical protein ABFD07_19635 [Methanobacterium sp.]
MSKETKGTVESDSSSYSGQEMKKYWKIDEDYEHQNSLYTKKETEEKNFNKLETDDRYTLNMPQRVKIRARIIND